MIKFFYISLLTIVFSDLSVTTYYVSVDGLDSNSGTSILTPWKTIDKLNNTQFQPGDSILFKRGDIFRITSLVPASGDSVKFVYYGAYGTGNKPTFFGSIDLSAVNNWINFGNNLWSTAPNTIWFDAGSLIFNNDSLFGVKKWMITNLSKQGDFWYDTSDYSVKLYSVSNPGNFYSHIECALTLYMVLENDRHHIIYNNLAFKYGGGHGIAGGNTHHIIIRNCEFSYIGGGKQFGSDSVRFGNAIEFWANAQYNIVENNKIWQIYDAAVTNQNTEDTVVQSNIIYRNNLISHCEFSFEIWGHPAQSLIKDIYFVNNTCLYAGKTWARNQRPDPHGRHLCFNINTAQVINVVIANNIFFESTDNGVFVQHQPNFDLYTLNNNCWYQSTDTMVNIQTWWNIPYASFTMAQFSNYQTQFNNDINSTVNYPVFEDTSNSNYHLTALSHCIDTGTPDTNGYFTGNFDFDNMNRLADGNIDGSSVIDMGCYEFSPIVNIFEMKENKPTISVFPNLFNEKVTIQVHSNYEMSMNYKLQIFDLFGSEVSPAIYKNYNSFEVFLTGIPNGIYFYRVTDEKQHFSAAKIILQY